MPEKTRRYRRDGTAAIKADVLPALAIFREEPREVAVLPESARRLAAMGASDGEIAAVLGIKATEIHARFSEDLKRQRFDRRIAIRGIQADIASRGPISMLVWLGRDAGLT